MEAETAETVEQAMDPMEVLDGRASTIIRDHMFLSAAAGFIPVPIVDLAAAFTLQVTMIGRLAKLYGVPFTEHAGKSVLMSFIGSAGTVSLGGGSFLSLAKSIPGVGTFLGAVTMPVSLGAFTYAIGKVFQAHFRQGGTLLDFCPSDYGDYFKQMFNRGRKEAAEVEAKARDLARKRAQDQKAAMAVGS
jgi:uncharacterized protein (DUF697 family)